MKKILIFLLFTPLFLIGCGGEPSDNSIEGNEGLRNRIIYEIGLGQDETFGFRLDEKYEMDYLIGIEEGFADMVYINIYQVNDSDIEMIRDLFKKNAKYVAKDTWNLCSANRYSKKADENQKTEIYFDSHCDKTRDNKDRIVSAECIVFSNFDDSSSGEDLKHEICLFDKYLQFYYGDM